MSSTRAELSLPQSRQFVSSQMTALGPVPAAGTAHAAEALIVFHPIGETDSSFPDRKILPEIDLGKVNLPRIRRLRPKVADVTIERFAMSRPIHVN